MQNINRVTISGNLTRDVELRATSNGKSVLNFGIAVNDSRRNPQTGEYEDVPNFIDVVAFGNQADALSRMLHKGMKVCVDGKLRWTQWETDGQKRSKVEVVAQHIELPPRQQQPQSQPQQHFRPYLVADQPEAQQYHEPSGRGDDLYSEDLPF